MAYAVAVLIVLALAAAVRVWLLVRAGWMIDFDEAVVGIAGQRILRGDRPFFFYGQPYMGSIESYAAAGLFAIFGAARWTLKLVPFVGCLLLTGVTIWVGRLTSGRAAGLLAGMFVAVAPVYVTVNELRALGGYVEVMWLGMIAAGFALLLARFPTASYVRTTGRHLALGLALGLGVWVNWLIGYFAVPITLFLLSRLGTRAVWSGLWASAFGFVIGSSPFWVYNVEHQGESFNWIATEAAHAAPIQAPPGAVLDNALGVIVPKVLGLTQPWGETPATITWIVGAVALAGLASLVLLPTTGIAVKRARGYGLQATDLWILIVLAGLVIYSVSTYGQTAVLVAGRDYTGRYLVPLAPAVAVAVAHLLTRPQLAPAMLRAGLAALYVVALAWGSVVADPELYFQSPYYPYLDLRYDRVIEYLDARGIRDVWADVGLGRVMSFESAERVRTADYLDLTQGAGIDRLPDQTKAVEHAARPVYVVVILTNDELPIESALRDLDVSYDIQVIYPYAVVIPAAPVLPKEIAPALGLQQD